LVAVNEAISPVPLEANPIAVLEFVHVKVPPVGILVKVVAGTVPELQIDMFEGTVAVGVGLTVMVYVDGVPAQLLTVGVTVIVAVIGEVPEFVAVNVGMFPEPLEARPILVLEFVQVRVPPEGTVGQLVPGTLPVLQTTTFAGTVTVGVG